MNATARFTEIVSGRSEDVPLDEGALLIAAHARPGLAVDVELRRLDRLAASCPDATFDGWRRHLFERLHFGGNVDDYYDPDNSLLDQVLRRRAGIPITLSVVGFEVGRRLGVPLSPIGMPGHFLLRHDGIPPVYVDAFHGGRLLDEGGCEERFRALTGADVPFLRQYLEPVGARDVLARMLNNLRAIYEARRQPHDVVWVLRLLSLFPRAGGETRRQLADALAGAGRFAEAAAELEGLAAALVDDEAKVPKLRGEARALRARLN